MKVSIRNITAAQQPHTQGQNQAPSRRPNLAPKERKVLTEEELTLYSVAEFTEKMTGTSSKEYRNTTKNENPIDNESSTKKSENEANSDSKDKTIIIKSHSNILSNTFSQEKGGVFDPKSIISISVESNKNNSEVSECLICFETINVGDFIRLIPCLHRFHKECLDNWLTSRSGSCPNCRYDLRPLREASVENSPEIDVSIPYNNLQPSSTPNRQPVIQNQNNLIFESDNTRNVNKKSMAYQVLIEMFREPEYSRRSRSRFNFNDQYIGSSSNRNNM
ncbi:E3 ubiquitin-protein ligase ZSWIM2 [Smittium culicis]|uniref:RING-type E3 ubiquitin transferase n=1 Tax=Smittium culicis TaxID=133412 RepID=A0A1R1X1M8_9FUNG|nr:E3 ubiquitin-protein ligase ZSWIM2 [Smittium culicis]